MIDFAGKVESDKDFLLEHLEDEIIEATSAELTILSIDVPGGGCPDVSQLGITNFVVKPEGTLNKIYSSNSFPLGASCINTGQTIGLIRTEKYVFESKIVELMNNYDLDYGELKNSFNIPAVNDFDISFSDSEGMEIEPAKNLEIPATDVFAKEVPVTYVSKNAEIGVGYLRILIW